MPDYIKGVTRIGGRLLPLIDVRRRLGLPSVESDERTCVVETTTSIPAALAVDTLERVIELDEREITPVSDFAFGANSILYTGFAWHETKPCLLLDMERIVGRKSQRTSESPIESRSEAPCPAESERSATARPGDANVRCHDKRTRMIFSEGSQSDTKDRGPLCVALAHSPWPLRMAEIPGSEPQRRCLELLSKPVMRGHRRNPGFRPSDPRLPAVAHVLLGMPEEFQTSDAAPLVATQLGCTPREYHVSHFRYDLWKLRARNLAERIGSARRYRLTRIGRLICSELVTNTQKPPTAASRPQVPARPQALSA